MSTEGDAIRAQVAEADAITKGVRKSWEDFGTALLGYEQRSQKMQQSLTGISTTVDGLVLPTVPPLPPVQPSPQPIPSGWTAVFDQTFKGMKTGSPGIDMSTIWADWGAGNYGDGTGQTEDSFGLMRNVQVTSEGLVIALRKEDYNCSPKTPNPAHYTGARFNTRQPLFTKGTRLELRYSMQAGRHGIWTASPYDDGEFDVSEQFYGSGEKERLNAINDYNPVTQKYKDIPVAYGVMKTRAVEWCCPNSPNDLVFFVDGKETHRIVGPWMPVTGHVVRLQVACGGKYDAGYGSSGTKKLPPPNEKAMICEYVRVLKPS